MGNQLQKDTALVEKLNPENVLLNWMKTVSAFQFHYNQMTDLVTACRLGHQQTMLAHPGLGQCSIKQLESLLDSMQQELERLLEDTDLFAQTAISGNYQRLVTHTRVLDALNREAQKLLVLTVLSAS